MKIAIIGSVGIPAKYGGFETLVEYLTKNISYKYEITVFCSSIDQPNKIKKHNNASLKYIPLKANGIQSIPYDILSLLKVDRPTKIVLILGVASGFFLPIYKLFTRKKIILNVDGLEWKREKWGAFAKWYLKNSERIAVKFSDVIIADNKVIQEHVLNSYNKKSELIEYGADHVKKLTLSQETQELYAFTKDQYAFKVCRIEPENNIQMILEAFENQTKYNLVLVGNWDKSEYGRKLFDAFHSCVNIHLLPPIYDQTILNELRGNCLFYVHGHSAGGTNPSLVEAMELGLPVISYDVNYNRETTENKAAYYFKSSRDLNHILKSIDLGALESSGIKLREISKTRYSWDIISKKYSVLFH